MRAFFFAWGPGLMNRDDGVRTRAGRGFSLVELLVVLGIVALLIGVLLPVLGGARDRARTSRCLGHMRHLAMSVTAYTNDHGRRLPQPAEDGDIRDPQTGSTDNEAAKRRQGEAVWFNALDRYLWQSGKDYQKNDQEQRNYAQFKQDPVWLTLPQIVNDGETLTDDDARTIKMNEFFGYISSASNGAGGAGRYKFFKLTAVPQPSGTLLFGDGRSFDTPAPNTGKVDVSGSRLFSMREAYVGVRHQGGANVVTVDLSARHRVNSVRTGSGENAYESWYPDSYATAADRPDVVFNFDGR